MCQYHFSTFSSHAETTQLDDHILLNVHVCVQLGATSFVTLRGFYRQHGHHLFVRELHCTCILVVLLDCA